MATFKNLSTRGRLRSPTVPSFLLLFLDLLHISVTNGARKFKFGILVGMYNVAHVYYVAQAVCLFIERL